MKDDDAEEETAARPITEDDDDDELTRPPSRSSSLAPQKDEAKSESSDLINVDLDNLKGPTDIGGVLVENGVELRRSKRERRKPSQVYVPQIRADKSARERVIHERKCFRCGGAGKTSIDGEREKEKDENEADDKESQADKGSEKELLLECFRCPKVYHMTACVGFEKAPRKTWTCPWHECCLCFRKASHAGGLLIHCADCPTTFCYDCFPPDYVRHNVSETYFDDLRKKKKKKKKKKYSALI
eukprot:Selendium_serpulae@DN2968_c0_g1_i1.p2